MDPACRLGAGDTSLPHQRCLSRPTYERHSFAFVLRLLDYNVHIGPIFSKKGNGRFGTESVAFSTDGIPTLSPPAGAAKIGPYTAARLYGCDPVRVPTNFAPQAAKRIVPKQTAATIMASHRRPYSALALNPYVTVERYCILARKPSVDPSPSTLTPTDLARCGCQQPARAAECVPGIGPAFCESCRTGLVGEQSLTHGLRPGFESAFKHTMWFLRIRYIPERLTVKNTDMLSEMD